MPVCATSDVKLCGRSRVATAARGAGCRDSRDTEICSRRDAALVLFGRGASAPGRKPGRISLNAKLAGGQLRWSCQKHLQYMRRPCDSDSGKLTLMESAVP